jgi:plasmid stabilization system protein ParE
MTFEVTPAAEDEAEDAAMWYEQQAGLGDDFIAAVTEAYQAIQTMPRAFGRVVPPRTPGELRRFLARRYPYKVVYQLIGDRIIVLAVTHTSRRPFYWRNRRVP